MGPNCKHWPQCNGKVKMSEENINIWHRVLALLRNFWVNLLAVTLGIVIAFISKNTAKNLIPIGNLYLSLLAMTILPIVFSAITHSLGQLLRSGKAKKYIGRLIVIFSITVILGGSVGVLGAILGKPGSDLGSEHHKMLGELLLYAPSEPTLPEKSVGGFVAFFARVVPKNIFWAFANNHSLAVIFVSILMGLALGLNQSKASGRLLEVLRGLYETFFKILTWVLYGLPVGLCCLVAGQIATIGSQYLFVLGKVTGLFYLCCGFMCVLYVVAMRVVTRLPTGKILKALRDPLALAFVSSNSLVAMPMAVQHLEDDLGQSHDVVELVVPLGIVMNRHAYPILFGFMTVFVSQVYNHPLGIIQLLQVSISSALIGMAAIGPAASVAPMLALILSPLGLPSGLAVATLVETTALVTPIVAMTHLFGSCATATLIGTKSGDLKTQPLAG